MGGKIAAVMVGLVVITVLPGCVSERDFEPIADAGWKPGFSYAYTVESHSASTGSVTVDGTQIKDFGKPEDIGPEKLLTYTVFNTQANENGIPLYLAMAEGGSSQAQRAAPTMSLSLHGGKPEVLAFRQSDLEPLYTNAYLNSKEARLSISTGAPGHAWLKFPLQRGDTWTGEPGSRMDFSFGSMQVESRVRGMVTKSGPNGPVDAVHIAHAMAIPDPGAARDKVIAGLEDEGITVEALDFDSSASRDLYFAPSLHNVVLDESQFDSHVLADLTQKGQHIHADITVTSTVTIRLVAASVVPGPERSLEDALGGKITLPSLPPGTGSGTSVGGPAPAALHLTADHSTVDVATSPTVTYRTESTGNVTNLRHTIVDADGNSVASDNGGDFAQKVLEPGTYTATVTGFANGGSLSDSVTLYADDHETAPAACPTLTGDGIATCASQPVPVRAGLRHLTVKAVRTPRAGEAGSGLLVLLDASGREADSAPMMGNEATLEMDGPLAPGAWSIEYRPVYGVLEQVEYRIDLLHSPADAPATAARLLAQL